MALSRSAVARDQALFVDGTASLASGDGGLTAGERDDLDLVDRRLEVTFWAPDSVAITSRSARLALAQGVAPPQDVLAYSDGGVTVPSSLPITGALSTSAAFSSAIIQFELEVSGLPIASCAPGSPALESLRISNVLGGSRTAGWS